MRTVQRRQAGAGHGIWLQGGVRARLGGLRSCQVSRSGVSGFRLMNHCPRCKYARSTRICRDRKPSHDLDRRRGGRLSEKPEVPR
jgi:hypothetical protein